MTCQDCRYSLAEPGAGYYHCRAEPPTILISPEGVMTVFPTMQAGGWCGLHSLSPWKLLKRLFNRA
jgi:hypothetical protein